MSTKRMRGLAIAAGMAGLLALTVGTAGAQASVNSSPYGGGYRAGPLATQSECLTLLAQVKKGFYVQSAYCEYLTYSPITGQSPDPGWYIWDFIENPNL